MGFSPEIEAFITEFVRDLNDHSAAVFAGAGMSKSAGYVDWPELLRDTASELGLQIEREHDLISLAQFHVNFRKGSAGLARKILQEFSEKAEPSEAHNILARLPIGTYWTTNYDTLIEDALRSAYKIADVKHSTRQLTATRPKRDCVVYKMHGDVTVPQDAILYKEQYERYHQTHAPFVTALSGDLVSKTFLFIGFSFTDPNLDYVLSRLHVDTGRRNHYCFVRREGPRPDDDHDTARYRARKQELRVDDLRRFGIQALLIDDYGEIPLVLREIESRYKRKTVFISGSAEEFGSWSRAEALEFVHSLAFQLVSAGYRVVNGFGWGIGSSVINGALEAIYGNPAKNSEAQLVVRPFPQHGDNLKELWEQYRQRMIALSGVAVFLFGNKLADGRVTDANGVIREFDIAINQGAIPIPVGATGYVAEDLWKQVLQEPAKYYPGRDWLTSKIRALGSRSQSVTTQAEQIVQILQELNNGDKAKGVLQFLF
jgi:hypothetical protein